MESQILLLKKIQDTDIQIGLQEAERRQHDADRERLASEAKEYEDRFEIIKNELEELEKTRLTLEEEAALSADRIKKSEERLKNIKNDREFKAVTKEMNAAKKEKQTKEGEVGKLREKVDEKKALMREQEETLKNKKTELEAKIAYIETNKEKWEKTIKDKKEEKTAIAKDIAPPLLKRYETIREKRQGIAIVPVAGGTCQGCHMNIPPQAYIQLQKGSSDLIFCPHCHRILYWNPALKTSEQEKGKPAISKH
ncbi:MAG: hypothetical protein HY266_05765 [Deltaproteobacteria bacterium]|nr:hypothetical protein [Deltaproteobacteria bacterium]